MFIWSYFRSVLGDPGRVPLYWVLHLIYTRVSFWMILNTRKEDTVYYATFSNRKDVIIVQVAIDVC